MESADYRELKSGFTLLGLLITVTIATLLLVVAVPVMHNLTLDERLDAAVDRFVTVVNVARSAAITRAYRVTLCHSLDLQHCDTDPQDAGHWGAGWIVFNDLDADGLIDRGDGEHILRVMGGVDDQLTVRSGSHFSRYMAYLPSGMSRSTMGVGNGSFRFCDERGGDYAKKVIISVTGRPRVTDGDHTTISCP